MSRRFLIWVSQFHHLKIGTHPYNSGSSVMHGNILCKPSEENVVNQHEMCKS